MKVALISFATIVVSTVLCTTSASSQTLPVREAASQKATAVTRIARHTSSSVSAAQLKQAAKQIGTIRALTWNCQDSLIRAGLALSRTKASVDIWSLPQSVGYRVWVARKWVKLAKGCQTVLGAHTLSGTNNWLAAMKIAQGPYPGTFDWLYAISDREGCIRKTMAECDWVWYGGRPWAGYHIGNDFLGADTVGGPMQFRFSTFEPYWRHAQEDLAKRGYIIPQLPNYGGPAKYQPWISPLAQALTAGYMKYYGKEGCHWCL